MADFFKHHRLIVNFILFTLLILLLLFPTYWRMLKPGIYSMHDFHLFRQFEFDKCVKDFQIPCRWAPDSGYDYGEPMFNFYTQLPYGVGEVFRILGFSVIDTIKILFSLSLILSFISMFWLSRQLWNNNWAGILSGLVYVYAPYRAVDVFVRGALPEAFSFIFFPLIVFFLNNFIKQKSYRSLFLFSLSLAALILTHNLSAFMFSFFLFFWGLFMIWQNKTFRLIPWLIIGGVLTIMISAFYLLPAAFENKYINISSTTNGYYDFRNHFVTLKQLLISRFWGYGASVWGENDGLSLSVGHVQWVLPIIIALLLILKQKFKKNLQFFILFGLGWFMLLLTHNKSEILWLHLPPMAYIQFPWRFLGTAVFCFALSSGILINELKPVKLKYISAQLLALLFILSALVALNAPFFSEDLWYNVTDKEYFSGYYYQWQTSSALGDFWPVTGQQLPRGPAPKTAELKLGQGNGNLVQKLSNMEQYQLTITSANAQVVFPIDYFPGWTGVVDNKPINIYPSTTLGLITANINQGTHTFSLYFKNTPVRLIGNLISLLSSLIVIFLLIKVKDHKYVE